MLRSALLFASSIAVASVACIDEPTFILDENDPTSSVSPTAPVSGDGDDEMVLIPTTTFATPGTLAPAAPGRDGGKGEDNGKGKGKGGGGKDDGEEEGGGGGGRGGGGGGDPGVDAPDGGADPASPGATTTVPAFWIDTREVSARAFLSCMLSGHCSEPLKDPGCTIADAALSSHPINCVTLDQARAYCAWRGKRLVTNDEWTAAAAGAELRPYPWGTDAPSATRLNACGGGDCGDRAMYPTSDGWPETAPRGSFEAGRSPEGVWDLAGNVAEWVDVSGGTLTRGGSFDDSEAAAIDTLAVRAISDAATTVGFRCAKDQ